MTEETSREAQARRKASGYHAGGVEVVMSVEAVAREAAKIAAGAPKPEELAAMI